MGILDLIEVVVNHSSHGKACLDCGIPDVPEVGEILALVYLGFLHQNLSDAASANLGVAEVDSDAGRRNRREVDESMWPPCNLIEKAF